jgi:predicted transcriptional regulator
MIQAMRTTLEIDDDVLDAIKALASQRGTTAGRVISELVRQELRIPSGDSPAVRNGFELLPAGGQPVTVVLIEDLLDDDR